MSWYGMLLLGLLALIGLVLLAGALSPVEHQAALRIDLASAPQQVFARITDFASLPSWRSELSRVELLPEQEGRRCYRELSKHGPMDLRVEELVPNEKLVTRIVTPGSPFGGTWTFRLEALGAGTRLTITENGEVYNLLFRALSRYVFGHSSTLRAYLGSLARCLGEPPAIETAVPAPAPERPRTGA